jgi:plastocyanin
MTTAAIAVLALVVVAGCGDEKKDEANKNTPPPLSADLKLKVVGKGDDAKFDKSVLKAKPGTVKITVSNPQDSGEKHGIGIDGGDYNNVKGVPVAPGRQTSLTVTLKPGSYKYFDSAKKFDDDKDLQGKIEVAK